MVPARETTVRSELISLVSERTDAGAMEAFAERLLSVSKRRDGSFGRRVGECVAEGGAGGDAEFGEDLVEVGGDRPRGEEQAGGDLFVGVADRGEQRDLA